MRWKWGVGGQRGREQFRNRHTEGGMYKNKMRNDKVWKVTGRETETLRGKTKSGSNGARVHTKKKGGGGK